MGNMFATTDFVREKHISSFPDLEEMFSSGTGTRNSEVPKTLPSQEVHA
jgi:hypothetical protein